MPTQTQVLLLTLIFYLILAATLASLVICTMSDSPATRAISCLACASLSVLAYAWALAGQKMLSSTRSTS